MGCFEIKLYVLTLYLCKPSLNEDLPCLGGPRFDTWTSQTRDFKLVVETPLSNERHIKDSSMQKLVDMLPE